MPFEATQAFRSARDFLLTHRDDYATAYAGFQWPKLGRFNWALDWFDQIAAGDRRNQTALCIAYEDGRQDKLTFAELSERSNRIANYFRSLGVRRGDRVLLMLGNIPPLWETMLAMMKLGAVIIPATTLLMADDLADRIARGRVKHIICAADLALKIDAACGSCTRIAIGGNAPGWHEYEQGFSASAAFQPDGETRASDPLQLYFTSGTTAKPKLVMHSHTSYPVGHLSTMYWIGIQPGDIHCNLSSPGWAKHAWSCFFAPWNAEATVFVINQSRFSARGLLDAITRGSVTTFCAPPTVWRMLITEKLSDWKVNLRELASAGEPLNPEVIEQVRAAWGLTIRDGYGQTETTAQVGNPPGQKLKVGAMGRPLPGYCVRLLDPNEKDAEEGELCLPLDPPPAALMPGYQGDDGMLVPLEGPAYRTGDVVQRDAEGYLTFVGRADDVFKSSDYRISPFEVESALIEHADVVECAVVPTPNPLRHALVKAFITLRAGCEPSRETALSIFQHSRKVLAPYKRVRRVEFIDLPKTISGKIRRVQLRTAEAERAQNTQANRGEFREEDFPELK
ncbi:MAG: putative o-succinylbenzoate-CoA ligase protein (acs) [Candidatus Angelobacter sp.]|nr:putative o-succinylbenzoate-CoA ligase protein (acs) [Candidatus Angelobacter sp.]